MPIYILNYTENDQFTIYTKKPSVYFASKYKIYHVGFLDFHSIH